MGTSLGSKRPVSTFPFWARSLSSAIWHREFCTSLKEVRRATCVFRQFEVVESSHRRTRRFIFKVTDLHLKSLTELITRFLPYIFTLFLPFSLSVSPFFFLISCLSFSFFFPRFLQLITEFLHLHSITLPRSTHQILCLIHWRECRSVASSVPLSIFSWQTAQGHPTTIFGKLSVRKTIWDLEFSDHFL